MVRTTKPSINPRIPTTMGVHLPTAHRPGRTRTHAVWICVLCDVSSCVAASLEDGVPPTGRFAGDRAKPCRSLAERAVEARGANICAAYVAQMLRRCGAV